MGRTMAGVTRGDKAKDLRLQAEDVIDVPQSVFGD